MKIRPIPRSCTPDPTVDFYGSLKYGTPGHARLQVHGADSHGRAIGMLLPGLDKRWQPTRSDVKLNRVGAIGCTSWL